MDLEDGVVYFEVEKRGKQMSVKPMRHNGRRLSRRHDHQRCEMDHVFLQPVGYSARCLAELFAENLMGGCSQDSLYGGDIGPDDI